MIDSIKTHRDLGRSDAGFTLLEFLAAFLILMLFLTAILAALAVAIRGDHQAAFLTQAVMLGRAKLAAAGVDYPLRPGTTTAEFANGYVWRAEVTDFRSIRIARDRPIPALWINVTVMDPRASGTRSLTLGSIAIMDAGRS